MSKLVEMTEIIERPTGLPYTSISESSSVRGFEEKICLRKVFINPEHVVMLREDENSLRKLQNGDMPDELDSRQEFTRVYLACGGSYQTSNLTIIGPIKHVAAKLDYKTKL